jgi:glycosyltransferase involved in cell wall biosynthesis
MDSAGHWGARLAKTWYLFASETDRRASEIPKKAAGSSVAEIGVNIDNYRPDAQKIAAAEEASSDKPKPVPLDYIVCVYDHTARGRAATAIRTLSMLAPRHPNLRLMFVGPGSDDEDLRMQAAALRVLHLVSFLGERDDQTNLMRDAHLGWVVAEADTGVYGLLDLMALGIPAVASEGGIAQRYIAHGISGALYPPDDSASTAAAVAGLLKNEESRDAMGKAARTRVAREFPETAMIEGFDRAANSARAGSRRAG